MRIVGDVPLRLASLALAGALWFVIAGRQTAERGLTIPVELRNLPRALELTGGSPNTIDVRVRASTALIDTLDPGRVLAAIDLAEAREGERIVQLTPGQIRVPFGFRVVRIAPSLLTLKLERTARRAIPVQARVVGRPAPGFELAEVSCEPAQVEVAGPRTRAEAVTSAYTEPVSVEGAAGTVQALVNVGLADPMLRLEDARRVRVTVRLRRLETLGATPPAALSGRSTSRPKLRRE